MEECEIKMLIIDRIIYLCNTLKDDYTLKARIEELLHLHKIINESPNRGGEE